MGGFLILEILIGICIAYAAFQYTAAVRRRRVRSDRNSPPPGYVRTDEVSIDPTTGVEQRVWYNPQTGERWYEKKPKP